MAEHVGATLLLGVVAAAANLIGGYAVSSQKMLDRFILRALIGLGAGFLLAATFLVVLPESNKINSRTPWLVLAGYLFVHLVQHTVAPHFHFGEETHHELHIHSRVGYTAVFGMTLHAFFDGALIASGFLLSRRIGILLFIAVVLHKIPEGFTAVSIMRAAGRSRRAARFSAELIGAATFFGVVLISVIEGTVRHILPFSAGVTLYVAASDLIPEVNREEGVWVSGIVFLGVIFYFGTEWLLNTLM
jgi:zinc transporter ZupT